MPQTLAVPAMARALPRSCVPGQSHSKQVLMSVQQRVTVGGPAGRSCNTGSLTPSSTPGLRPTSSLWPACQRASPILSTSRTHDSSTVSLVSSAAMWNSRSASCTAQSRRKAENDRENDQARTAAWAFGCASLIAGMGHILSEDSISADAAPAAVEAPLAQDTEVQALTAIARLAGTTAKDAAAAVKLVAAKGLLGHADPAVRKEALAALLVLLAGQEARDAAWGAGLFKAAAALAVECKQKQDASPELAALLPLASEVLRCVSEGRGKGVGAKELSSLVELLSSPFPGSAAVVEALRSLSGDASTLPSLIQAGAVKACAGVLADASSSQEALASAACLLANLNAFGGSWTCSAAFKAPGWQEAVRKAALLTAEPHVDATRLAAVSALGAVLGSAAVEKLDGEALRVAVAALGYVAGLAECDGGVRAAALAGLAKASGTAAGAALVGETPTAEALIVQMGSEEEAAAAAAMAAVENVAKGSTEAAARLCLAGAVQGAVTGAMAHRGSLEVRERVAGVLEVMVNSRSEDAVMRVAHYATPVVVALARTADEEMQVRALECLRRLSLNGMNKFSMQKNFEVVQELVPLLSRSSVAQQAILTETLAHLASTDNAYYGENARVLGEARGMKPLMTLARSRDPKVHRNATWALACMTACERNHVPMRAAIDTLLQVVERGSPAAQRYAVMAISNLAATQRTREILSEKGAEGILRKCAQANSGDRMIAELIRTSALVNLKRGGKQVFNIPPP